MCVQGVIWSDNGVDVECEILLSSEPYKCVQSKMGSYNVCYLSRLAFAFSNKYSRSKIKFEIIVSVLFYAFNALIIFLVIGVLFVFLPMVDVTVVVVQCISYLMTLYYGIRNNGVTNSATIWAYWEIPGAVGVSITKAGEGARGD